MDFYLIVVGMAGAGLLAYWWKHREQRQTSGLSKPVEELEADEVGPELRSLCNSCQFRLRQAAGDVAIVIGDNQPTVETWVQRAHLVGLPGQLVPPLFPELADSGEVDEMVAEAYAKLRRVVINADISLSLLRVYDLDSIIRADIEETLDQWLIALDRLDFFLWDVSQYPDIQTNRTAYIIYIALGRSWLRSLIDAAVRGVFG